MAQSLGTNPQSINDVVRGKKRISREFAENVHRVFSVNLNWLLTGEGEPFGLAAEARKASDQAKALAARIEQLEEERDELAGRLADMEQAELADRVIQIPDSAILKPGDPLDKDAAYSGVPLITDAAAAGEPRIMADEIDPEDPWCVVHRRIAPKPADYCACWVEGESMLPVIPPGSIVIVHLTEREPANIHGTIIAARYDEGVTIKTAYVNGPHLTLVPANPDRQTYPIRTINMEDEPNAIIGRVVYACCDYSSPPA